MQWAFFSTLAAAIGGVIVVVRGRVGSSPVGSAVTSSTPKSSADSGHSTVSGVGGSGFACDVIAIGFDGVPIGSRIIGRGTFAIGFKSAALAADIFVVRVAVGATTGII